jgi:hypothetical protein
MNPADDIFRLRADAQDLRDKLVRALEERDAAMARVDKVTQARDAFRSEFDRMTIAVDALTQENQRLRNAIETVLRDDESAPGGWGPDVTCQWILREALNSKNQSTANP